MEGCDPALRVLLQLTREFKYWAALAALKLCPWALPPGLRMLGRYGRAGN